MPELMSDPNLPTPDLNRSRPELFNSLLLCICLTIAIFLRWPMVAGAAKHLDSDLAVDGLTLRQLVEEGQWRWHYPGTPHIGTAPMILSLPAVALMGDGPKSLVFAGLAANLLLIIATYLIALKFNGRWPAFFAGIAMAAGGLGQVWLSARVTGGHLLAAAWMAWAWYFWTIAINSVSIRPWLLFGLFCGLGLWVDSIFLLGLAGLFAASLAESWKNRRSITLKTRLLQAFSFSAMLPAGMLLTSLGDGENSYGSQFELSRDANSIIEHTRILVMDCLPRLFFGRSAQGLDQINWPDQPFKNENHLTFILIAFALSIAAIILKIRSRSNQRVLNNSLKHSLWLGFATLLILNLIAFVLNKNIFNSDNYRYLVLLLPIFGVSVASIAADGRFQLTRRLILVVFSVLLGNDVYNWQIHASLRESQSDALQQEQKKKDRIQTSRAMPLEDIFVTPGNGLPPIVNGTFEADYWVVYKSIYLFRLPLNSGRPFGFYPDRFISISPKNPSYLVISDNDISRQMLASVRNDNFIERFESPNYIVLKRDPKQIKAR
jgi:hypothetical protein